MIVKFEKNKIKGLKIGNFSPDCGEICVQDNWGSEKIISTFSGMIKKERKYNYKINENAPDKSFNLKRLC